MERSTARRTTLSARSLSEPLINDDKRSKHRPIKT